MDGQLLVVTSRLTQGERSMGGMELIQATILSPQDLLLILLIALLFFGGKKLPELGSSLGKAMREFRQTTDAWDQDAPGESTPRALGTPAPSSPPAAEASKHEPEVPTPRSPLAAEAPRHEPEAPGTRV